LYAAYWAFTIRRALVVRIYRNQALWLGVLCVVLAGTGWGLYTNNTIISNTSNVFSVVEILGLFALADSSIRVARRSDPLLRSILQWEKVRIPVWIALGALTILLVTTGLVVIGYFVGLIILLGFPTATALLIGARRSGDPLLQRDLKWLGVFLLCVVATVIVPFLESGLFSADDIIYSYPAIPGIVIDILAAYALYRTARSLAPMNRLSLEAGPKAEPIPP